MKKANIQKKKFIFELPKVSDVSIFPTPSKSSQSMKELLSYYQKLYCC